jgi:hypothetical protein
VNPARRVRRSTTRHSAAILTVLALAACGPQIQSTASSVPVGSTAPSIGVASPAPTLTPSLEPSAPPTVAPTVVPPTPAPTPAPTPFVTEGFQYGDILKVQVNSLAARQQPKRSAALVHGYDLDGPAPVDDGLVRLDKGDFVSVHLGPLRVGQTVWYLVWPSDHGGFHDNEVDWYHGDPGITAGGPAWVAASVGESVYLKFQRRPDQTELETFLPVGVNAAGTGPYVSPPQQRHDFFLFDWAASTPVPDTSCSLKVTLVPSDPAVAPVTAINTTTTSVKVASLDGKAVNAPWLPAPDGSWSTFTVNVSGTCRWAIRLTRLDHD